MAALWRSRRRQQQALALGRTDFLFGSGEWKAAQGGTVGGNRGGGENDYAAYKCREKCLGGCWRTSGHCPPKV